MQKIIYNGVTGEIKVCRQISDQMWQRRLQTHPDDLWIPGSVADASAWKVDLETHQLVALTNPGADADYIRTRRNSLLLESDWTQGLDSPLNDQQRSEWQTYRQALRDITTQYDITTTAKTDIVWPTKPGA